MAIGGSVSSNGWHCGEDSPSELSLMPIRQLQKRG